MALATNSIALLASTNPTGFYMQKTGLAEFKKGIPTQGIGKQNGIPPNPFSKNKTGDKNPRIIGKISMFCVERMRSC